jgi:putative membrane protein insertion efficiency factor
MHYPPSTSPSPHAPQRAAPRHGSFVPAWTFFGSLWRAAGDAMRGLMLLLIRAYQLGISPLLRPSCRYHPSCSEYAHAAIRLHGPLRGAWLGLRRLLRCHPFAGAGYDPVPDPRIRDA